MILRSTLLAAVLGLAFAGSVSAMPDKAGTLPSGHPPISGAQAAPSIDLKGIKKAEGGKTVQEVISEANALKGKSVAVRGKVVKVNTGIMGKNWLHIADGSGPDGKADLTVTTTANPPKLGDLVTVTGKVAANKDFGAGYKYDVIMEDASIKAQ